MQDLLAACVELEALANDLYPAFAETTSDDGLRLVFNRMQADEVEHLSLWRGIQSRVCCGEFCDLSTHGPLTAYMRAIGVALRALPTSSLAAFSDEDLLALAASLEFYALDPIFSQMVAESDPSLGFRRQEEYEQHVGLLASAMEARGSSALAPHVALLRGAPGADTDSIAPGAMGALEFG